VLLEVFAEVNYSERKKSTNCKQAEKKKSLLAGKLPRAMGL